MITRDGMYAKGIPYFLSCIILFILFSVVRAQPTHHSLPAVSELYSLLIEFQADYGSLTRFYFVPGSPERRQRLQEFYRQYDEYLDAIPFGSLSTGGQVDYLLFKRKLKELLFRLEREQQEVGKIKHLLQFGEPIYALEKTRRRGLHQDAPEVAGQLHEVLLALQKNMSALKDQPLLPQHLVARLKEGIQGYGVALKSFFEFYDGYDPMFSWWVTRPYKDLDTALVQYEKQIQTLVDPTTQSPDDGSGIVGTPIGRKELIRQLEYEMIPYSPEELIDIAHREFAWCDAEIIRASREMGFGDDWKKAQEKVKQAVVPPGYQPEAMLRLYEESVAFLKQHHLLTIPPLAEETWRMGMISPERQLVSPFFLGGEKLQISYPTDEMRHSDKWMSMRGNNPHFSRATVHHELIAGHHLQAFMNDRHKTYRNDFTAFWTEGWALYWEILLWDLGFPQSPEDRIGMLFWRMHRCARIVFSIKYHLGEWTPQQCIDFIVDRVGHERANAEGEVRRSITGGYGPLYQIAYLTGGLQFYALKRELVDSGQMTYAEFHDAVLRENNMPVEMVRAILTRQPLTKEFKTNWRFYSR